MLKQQKIFMQWAASLARAPRAARLMLVALVLSLLQPFSLQAQFGGNFSFATNRFAVSENDGLARITITRDSEIGMMQVELIVENGTATNMVDFRLDPATNRVTFNHFQTAVTIIVPIINNTATNTTGQSAAKLLLANPRPALGENPDLLGALGRTLATSQLIIFDDDRELRFNLERTAYSLSEPMRDAVDSSNAVVLQINVVLPKPPGDTSQGVEVDYTIHTGAYTRPGSDFARPTEDYEFVETGTLAFGPNDVALPISITVTNDSVLEFNEDFHITLTEARGSMTVEPGPDGTGGGELSYAIGPAREATVTILPSADPFTPKIAGALDLDFNPDNSATTTPPFNNSPGANNTVSAVAHDAKGHIIVAGDFGAFNAATRTRIARLLPTGLLDTNFNPNGGANDFVSAAAVYTNGPLSGQILVAGGFTAVNGVQRPGVARLNALDGSIDSTFDPGNGANGPVYALALQRDGGILLGGDFTVFNGVPRNRLARLTSGGALDLSFDPGFGPNAPVYTIFPVAADPITITNSLTNGVVELFVTNIAVGATSGFITLSYNFFAESNNIVVLSGTNILYDSGLAAHEVVTTNAAGGLDTNYVPSVVPFEFIATNGFLRFEVNTLTNAASNWTFTVSIQPDIALGAFIGGDFSTYDGAPHGRLARLNADGTADLSFATNNGLGADDTVFALAIQKQRLLLGGSFQAFNSFPSPGIAALTPEGFFDRDFAVGSGAENGDVYSILVEGSGRIFIGGNFSSFNQTRRTFLARLLPDGPLDTSFLDAAYNQYAGFPNPTGFAPSGTINSMSLDTNGNLVAGGLFFRVGGGAERDDSRPRNNIARLHGGSTPGPGNVDLLEPVFGADENSGALSVVLRRENGSLGAGAVLVSTRDGAAVSGVDFVGVTNAVATWGSSPGGQQANGSRAPLLQLIPIRDDTVIEGNEPFQISLSAPVSKFTLGGEFIPAGLALGRIPEGRGLIVENDVPSAVLSFTASEFDANENDRQVTINVTRSGALSSGVSVRYATLASTNAGAATVGLDYSSSSGTLSFASGQTNKSFTISLTDDEIAEQDEIVLLALVQPSLGAVLGTNSSANLNIVDNDYTPGRISLSATNYSVPEGSEARITVRRSGGNVGVVTVNYATFDGTATVPFDYDEAFGTLQWNHGDTAPKTISVRTSENGLVHGSKTFFVRLSGLPPEAFGNRTQATVTLLDNDAVGAFSFNAAEFLADENGTNVVINVVRRGGSSDFATVDYATEPIDAVPGVDYQPVSGTLQFGVGETSQSFIVAIFDNAQPNPEKQIRLVLANPQPGGAVLGLLTNAVLSIVDNESLNIPAGSVETDFAVSTGANDAVHALALHSNGLFYIGGDFTVVNRQVRTYLARLNTDGALDRNFGVDYSINGPVRAIDLQEDGRLFIAGSFTAINDFPSRHLARLSAGGTLDTTFVIGSGADNPIFALKSMNLESERKLLIGGNFSVFNGVPRRGIARVSDDGRADLSFDPGSGVNGTVMVIELQRDGKILIGGEFTSVDGVPRINVARLHPDGSLDRSFDAGLGADGSVRSISIQFDDRIVLGGLFTSVSSVDRHHIARLYPDGTLDPSFDPGSGAVGGIYATAIQVDGKIVVAGDFVRFDGIPAGRIVRLNPDGSIDPGINFGRGADAFVSSIALQSDRRMLIGGGFTEIDGLPRNRFARLYGGSLSGSGEVEFAAPVFAVAENATNVLVTVRRSAGLFGTASVAYSSRANTASSAVDYVDVQGSLTFAPGENTRTFLLPLIDDSFAEPNEFVNLILSEITGGAVLGDQPVALVSILSDDSIISFSEVSYSVNEGTPGGRTLVQIEREGETSQSISVILTASQGTAFANEDFIPLTTNVVIPAGESTVLVPVQILDDQIVEESESVVLRLSSPSATASLGRAAASLTIVDDDTAAGILDVLSISPVREGSQTVTATITRSSGRTGLISVQYNLTEGTARAGADYVAASGTIFFNDSETIKTVSIAVLDDQTIEGDESLVFALSNPGNGAQIGTGSSTIVILDDDLPSGSLDPSFNTGSGVDGPVLSLKFGLNNRLLIGGEFFSVHGVARSRVARLNPNGGLDTTFEAEPGPNGPIWDLELDAEGEVIMAGDFNALQGTLLNRIARLEPQGDLDAAFSLPLGFNAAVLDAVRQPDGKIVVGGLFTFASATARGHVARLHRDGTLDLQFNPGSAADGDIAAVVLQGDKILVGGGFNTFNRAEKRGIARLLPNGSLDTTFNRSGIGITDGTVNEVLLLDDARILIGGSFSGYNGAIRPGIALLDRDGNLQANFNPGEGPNGAVLALAQQEDGKFLVGGDFTAFAGQTRNHIARLNPNGSLDQNFAPGGGLNGTVMDMLIQPSDGKILVAGFFTAVDNQPRAHVARLNNDREFVRSRTVTFTPVVRAGNQLQLTVNSVRGFTYTLESSATLAGPWVRGQSIVSEGSTATFTIPPTEAHRFFRIRRE